MMKKTAKKRLVDDDGDHANGDEKKGKSKGYNANLDKVLKKIGTIEDGGIFVNIVSYNGGPAKLALGRSGEKKDGSIWISSKLGRLNESQLKELIPFLQKGVKRLRNLGGA